MTTLINGIPVVPQVYRDYALLQVAATNSMFAAMGQLTPIVFPEKGYDVTFPLWKEHDTAAEDLQSGTSLTINAIGGQEQKSVQVARGTAFGAEDQVKWLTASDPIAESANQVGRYWNRDINGTSFAVVTAAADASEGTPADILNDISALTGGAELITNDTALDTLSRMGDFADQVVAVAMHSDVRNYLSKTGQTSTIVDENDRKLIDTFVSKPIVVDDVMAPVVGVYYTVFFMQGAVAYGTANDPSTFIESDRDIQLGQDFFTTRLRYVTQVPGMKWVGTPAGNYPTRTELALGTNWEMGVDSPKQMRMVVLKHKIV